MTRTRKGWPVTLVACAVLALGGWRGSSSQHVRAGAALDVSATAYCTKGTTRAGTHTRRGIVAADPRVLPLGSVVRVKGLPRRHNGIYTVTDTGREVKGREIDIFMPDCTAAERFGRQAAEIHVLRLGWSSASSG